MTRRRLDQELLRRGLCPSRSAARSLIETGRVLVGGSVATKPARMVDPGESLVVQGDPPRFVSRGGDKLAAALEEFGIDPAGLVALDAGASTGGFTDCLLQHGVTRVVAVDVGHGQLDQRLRADSRVDVRERTNIRHLDPGQLPTAVDIVVADLSFISLRTVLPQLVSLARPGADLVLLVKPQFEAGRVEASRGRGVIRDPAVWNRVLDDVLGAASACNLGILGLMASPLAGADGNREFLLHARVRPVAADEHGSVVSEPDRDALVAAAIATAEGGAHP